MKLSIQKALLPDAMPIARLLDGVTVQLHQKGILQWEHLGIRIKSDRTSCWNGCGHAGTAKSWSALFRCGRCRPPYGWTAGQSLTANGICIGWLCAPPARAAAWAQSSSVLPAVWQTMRKRIFIWIAGREITLCAASILRQILIQLVYFRKKITKYASFPAISAKKGSGKKGFILSEIFYRLVPAWLLWLSLCTFLPPSRSSALFVIGKPALFHV